MKYLIYIILILVLMTCRSGKYSVVGNFDPSNKKSIALNSSYEFYLREIYKDSSEQAFALKKESDTLRSRKNKLIEIEYLLYSKPDATVIYITTVPDKYQNYYSKWRLNDPRLLNAYDFNTFHLGKIKVGEGIVFRDIKKNDITLTWEIEKEKDSLSILHIIEKKDQVFQGINDVRNSLSNGAVFKSIPEFQIVLRNFQSTNSDTLKMAKPVIYIGQRKRKYCEIYFQFENQIPVKKLFKHRQDAKEKQNNSKQDEKNTTILFKGIKRVPYTLE